MRDLDPEVDDGLLSRTRRPSTGSTSIGIDACGQAAACSTTTAMPERSGGQQLERPRSGFGRLDAPAPRPQGSRWTRSRPGRSSGSPVRWPVPQLITASTSPEPGLANCSRPGPGTTLTRSGQPPDRRPARPVSMAKSSATCTTAVAANESRAVMTSAIRLPAISEVRSSETVRWASRRSPRSPRGRSGRPRRRPRSSPRCGVARVGEQQLGAAGVRRQRQDHHGGALRRARREVTAGRPRTGRPRRVGRCCGSGRPAHQCHEA